MFILEDKNSIANHFLAELRNETLQNDRLKFRRNLERLGEVMAYEVSKAFDFSEIVISSPLGKKKSNLILEQPILIAILRAALPFYQGFLNFFDQADSGFIGAFRKEEQVGDPKVEVEYLYQATPDINNKTLILIDPMLATGKSIVKTIENLLLIGNPKEIHIVSVIAAPEGIEFLKASIKQPYQLWICSLDECLNDQSYIIPGLGDAGDLCFGNKI
ncbi:uracil phosphoribosyltransferase [Cognataquiflexum rubidum]|uniref:uracil phosphoribosyltransferase n=1 Tax=Cognataquiflexum rubidum TaxID=2922273 RepID=UPI001F12E576|nr:uracil phosphoribosyltransferase [Cognataquiflexum rubidum]MCH6234617.1 uracil phosphoribosyltransferase [Cognataquiflexum rubidum]